MTMKRKSTANEEGVGLSQLVRGLIDVGSLKVAHIYMGQCPDSVDGPGLRDENCKACQILTMVDSFIANASVEGHTD